MSVTSKTPGLRVLVFETDANDLTAIEKLCAGFRNHTAQVDMAEDAAAAMAALTRNRHDVCLLACTNDSQRALELLRMASEHGCQMPILLIAANDDFAFDKEAMQIGAAECLSRTNLDSNSLERAILHTLDRRRAAERAAIEQARLAAFGEEIGLALTRSDPLDVILLRCASTMAHYLDAALARIWIHEPSDLSLKLSASAGPIAETSSGMLSEPMCSILQGECSRAKPLLIQRVAGDARIIEQAWAARERVVSFAGHPLSIDGRLVGFMSIFSRRPLHSGAIQEMASVANGIALCIDRKRSAEALDASEVKYQSVVENIKEVIFQIDLRGNWTFLNPAWTKITGFEVKPTLGTAVTTFIHPEDRERHDQLYQAVLDLDRSFVRDEVRYLAADGTFRWMEVYAQPIFGKQNTVEGLTGTLTDITERKRAETEIQKLAAFPRFNPDPVMELAADGTLTYLNKAAGDLAAELNSASAEAILPRNAASIAEECLRQGQNKLAQQIQVNGRTLNWSFFPIVSCQVVHCYGVDVTERMSLETQLRHSQKLDSIGQLAAGVAHDFNNILTIIHGHTNRLIDKCLTQPDLIDELKVIAISATRAAGLTRQLLTFSRKQKLQPKVLNLGRVIGDVSKMLERLLGEHITLETRFESTTPRIEADIGMIDQIIMNLSVNARDAMPKGGTLRIGTSAATIDENYVQLRPEARPGHFARLSVTDNGTGMSRETIGRIFEPFFTTKEVGKGTGLGLATVYGIVKQHGGWIEVDSELGLGTTFNIFLPATNRESDTCFQRAPKPAVALDGPETILIVEDEPLLLELARLILQGHKYRVLEAGNGKEALKVWEENHGKIDLLLTDMVMPEGMTGHELASELKKLKPELKVIYTSGYSSDVMGGELAEDRTTFLQKPYAPPQLVKTVRECLDACA